MASVPFVPLGLLLVGLLAGTVGAASLAVRLPAARHVAVRPRDAARSGENALVSVRGSAGVEPGVGTVTTPFAGRSALAVEYEVQTPADRDAGASSTPDPHDDDAWSVTHRGTGTRRFVLRDDDGGVSVVPDDDVSLGGGWDETVVVDPDDDPPERIARFVEEAAGIDPPGPHTIGAAPPRRFVERAIVPGDAVVVYGEARVRAHATIGDAPGREVVEPSGLGVFHLSRESEPPSEGALGGGAALGTGIGFTALGLASLLGVL
jgi:hypothetical protein